MRLPRLPVDRPLASGERLELDSETVHYVQRVLRLPHGAAVRLFNGDAGDWHGTLEIAGKRQARVTIERFEPRAVEPTLALTLVQGISRGQRMDYTLEKAVELGVSAIVPVVMERTQAPPAGERIARKARHWHGVVASAAAQSGRTRQPTLSPQTSFRDWLGTLQPSADHPCLLLDPDADGGPAVLGNSGSAPPAITLVAGPEGGFSPSERKAARAAGCQGLRLGPRVLRTETAAVAALAALQALYGDLG